MADSLHPRTPRFQRFFAENQVRGPILQEAPYTFLMYGLTRVKRGNWMTLDDLKHASERGSCFSTGALHGAALLGDAI